MKKLTRVSVSILVALVIAIAALLIWAYLPVPSFQPVEYEPQVPDYWPTEGWRYSTPEEQGMSSQVLAEMMAYYDQARSKDPTLYIDSMTVIRNGYVVAEFYNNSRFPRDELHVIHSATKSIVSALVGIAIDKGHIASVDVPVVEIFADRQIKNLDERKRAMTIRDLLTMETGLHSRDSYLYSHEGLFAIQDAEDWLQFALDLPMAAAAGERFDYSNISTFLLSAILTETTGRDTLTFAREQLFEPLGISDVEWEWNSEGLAIAWARMWLKPNDLAKIGLLFLQRGVWQGDQIVPAAWVRDSVTPWAYPKNAVNVLKEDMSKDQEASTQNWVAQRFVRPFSDGYGYQWWLDRKGHYTALGFGGQYLTIAPEHDLIFVATSKCSGIAQFAPATLFQKFVLGAVESDRALVPNSAALEELRALAGPPELTQPVAKAIPGLPAIAGQVSGVAYAMQDNPFNTDNIRLVFDPQLDYAELSYTSRECWNVSFRVGLDQVHRLTETDGRTFAAVGRWASPNTFFLEAEIIGYSTFDRWEFSFDGEEVVVTEFSITGDYRYRGWAVQSEEDADGEGADQ